jgi:hypothetical protein
VPTAGVPTGLRPPDRPGHVSLGTNADYVAALIGRAPFFLETNPRRPRTFGLNQLHVMQVLCFCEAERPLIEVAHAVPDGRDEAIVERIREHIRIWLR